MATAKQVSNISDKLVKVTENFTINMYDNGFMIEVYEIKLRKTWKESHLS